MSLDSHYTDDLLEAGATVIIDKKEPMIKMDNTLFPIYPLNKH